MPTSEQIIPQIPIEPAKLIVMWGEAARDLAARGEGAAAGAFVACAQMLETWMAHEGPSLMVCMPRTMLALIHAANGFRPDDKDTWHRLGQAAADFKNEA